MTLTVEDGTVVSGANTYVNLATADAYHLARGREVDWVDLDSEVREQSLILATQEMEARYRTLWKGKKRLTDSAGDAIDPEDQPLSWPRKDVEDEDGYGLNKDVIPAAVKVAQMEVALQLAGGQNFVEDTITRDTAGVLREKIGPLETQWAEGTQSVPTFPLIDQILEPLITGSGNSKLGVTLGLTDHEKDQLEGGGLDPFFDPSKWPEFFTIIED